jgi:hypothetical protein
MTASGYDTAAHRFLIEQVEREGIIVVTGEPSMTLPVYSNRGDRTVWIKDGLSLPAFHWALACATLHQLFGIEPARAVDVATPPARQPLRLITGGVR